MTNRVYFVLIWVGCICIASTELVAQSKKFFPKTNEKWETTTAKNAGLKQESVDAALDLSFKNKSTSVVILYNGRIVAERHLLAKDPKLEEIRLGRMRIGADKKNGHSIEDVASVQKSVAAVVLGIAINKGLVKLEDPVSKYLGKGWSKATKEQESKIQVRHLVSMTSGLNRKLGYVAAPGSKWAYNTSAYALVMKIVEKAGRSDRDSITHLWLTDRIGMFDSKWVKRPNLVANSSGNQYGFATTARDLAKLGWLVMSDGKWGDATVYEKQDYFDVMTRSSQDLNPAYGYLWWLNGQKFCIEARRRQSTRVQDSDSANRYVRCFGRTRPQTLCCAFQETRGCKVGCPAEWAISQPILGNVVEVVETCSTVC